MRIGVTERGDPSLDFSWIEKQKSCDGIILITKNLTEKVKNNINFDKTILHNSCTGWGSTVIEPNILNFKSNLDNLNNFIRDGFPREQVVLRIDPIFPTQVGIKRALEVLSYSQEIGLLEGIRIRISILDLYAHVKERFSKMNFKVIPLPYDDVYKRLASFNSSVLFEVCAEPKLDKFIQIGCVSTKDLEILGIEYNQQFSKGFQRKTCQCLSCKYELLTEKKRCGYNCMYCYWRD